MDTFYVITKKNQEVNRCQINLESRSNLWHEFWKYYEWHWYTKELFERKCKYSWIITPTTWPRLFFVVGSIIPTGSIPGFSTHDNNQTPDWILIKIVIELIKLYTTTYKNVIKFQSSSQSLLAWDRTCVVWSYTKSWSWSLFRFQFRKHWMQKVIITDDL